MAENETHSRRPVSPAEIGQKLPPVEGRLGDTTSPPGRLMLTVLGGLADFERDLIRARTGEGRKRAQERGVKFGWPRPRKVSRDTPA